MVSKLEGSPVLELTRLVWLFLSILILNLSISYLQKSWFLASINFEDQNNIITSIVRGHKLKIEAHMPIALSQ